MCFAIIAGKLTTTDGSVIFGHNEQNYGRKVVNYTRVESKNYSCETGIKLNNGGLYRFNGETYSYLWLESPGLEFSDNCFNEHGVAVAGNGCPTKEDDIEIVSKRGDIIDGGVGYMLPQLIAMLAKTAKEGVLVAAKIIEQFGYTGTGRTLTIADANEAWIMSIVRGKHYIANRVPDDKVVVVPNTHIINQEIHLNDPSKTIYSKGLIEYAIARGWHNKNKQFNFTKAYSSNANAETLRNKYGVDSRQWYVQSLISGKTAEYPPKTALPFAVKPKQKVNVKWVMGLLRSHLENIPQLTNFTDGNPHRYEADIDHCLIRMACNIATQESSIFQLRSNYPVEFGCLAWRALSVPCLSVYTPWYCGIKEVPARHHVDIARDKHYNPPNEIFKDENMAFWSFYNLAWYADRLSKEQQEHIKQTFAKIEDQQFNKQQVMEDMFSTLYNSNKKLCLEMITQYSEERSAVAELVGMQLLKDN